MPVKKQKDPLRASKLNLIGRLVEIPESKLLQRSFWPREVKIANELYSKYNPDFWSKVKLEYKLKSLAFLKSERGMEELEKKWREFNFTPLPLVETKYEPQKVGGDALIKKMPNLLDFLCKKP